WTSGSNLARPLVPQERHDRPIRERSRLEQPRADPERDVAREQRGRAARQPPRDPGDQADRRVVDPVGVVEDAHVILDVPGQVVEPLLDQRAKAELAEARRRPRAGLESEVPADLLDEVAAKELRPVPPAPEDPVL